MVPFFLLVRKENLWLSEKSKNFSCYVLLYPHVPVSIAMWNFIQGSVLTNAFPFNLVCNYVCVKVHGNVVMFLERDFRNLRV